MQLVRNTSSFPHSRVANGCALTVGAFDGLHLGHRRLLERTRRAARQLSAPSVVMSFEPTPKEFFAGDRPPARLTRFREKFEGLRDAGIDLFFCPRFDAAMRDMDAASFIRRLLVHTLNVRQLVVGEDFRFARSREGNIEMLQTAAAALGFCIEQVPSVVVEGERVSSTAIRAALKQGDLDRAARLLGRPYRMSGRVIHGDKLGRRLGYPTANVELQRRQSAVDGVFAVRVDGIGGRPLDAVASVGRRPTFGGRKPLLEVHVFDFDGDLYGRYIHVDFIRHLRDQIAFESAEALVEQIHIDTQQAREILAS